VSLKATNHWFVDRTELDEHRQTAAHKRACGICGEMSDTRDVVKSCFYSHLVYISDTTTASRGQV